MKDWWRVKDLVPFLQRGGERVWLGNYARIEDVASTITGQVRATLSGVLPDSLALFNVESGDTILVFHNPCGRRCEPSGRLAASLRINGVTYRHIPTLVFSDSPDLVGFTVDIKADLALFGAEPAKTAP